VSLALLPRLPEAAGYFLLCFLKSGVGSRWRKRHTQVVVVVEGEEEKKKKKKKCHAKLN
jgi:hypothetical protein